ncbi:MAG: ABC transporter ATP-binding protein [Nitriliruptorales bacterium]
MTTTGAIFDGLACEGLGFRYPGADRWALRNVDLAVAPGQIVAVVGPSGSGKSTLLRLVCGLATPTEGLVRFGRTTADGLAPERRPVAMVFQGFALFPHLTVQENIAFGPRVRREPKDRVTSRVARAADALGITALLDRYPAQLSGGECQRTALARALVREPRVFLLDEPLSSLDPVLRADSRRLLTSLLRAEGRCALYVTHDQAEAMTMGDLVAVLRNGHLEQVGSPRDVYDRPASQFVASFLGTPPMSLLTADADGKVGPIVPPILVPVGGSLGVRAEDVTLLPGEGRGKGTAQARALVTGVEDVGHEAHVELALGGQALVARVAADAAPARDEWVWVRVAFERVRVFDAQGRAVGP